MKLSYGIYQGNLIHISEVDSGRTKIICPFCEQKLVAKKGKLKRHHFAHEGTGCQPYFSAHLFALTGKLPTQWSISVYGEQKLKKIHHYFENLQNQYVSNEQKKEQWAELLPAIKTKLHSLDDTEIIAEGKEELIAQLDRFVQQKIAPFPEFHLIRSAKFGQEYTDGSNNCFFNQLEADRHEYFYPKSFQPYVDFLKKYHQNTYEFKEIGDKIRLFSKELAYFQKFELYFIEIKADYQTIYKIGLTSRPLSLRMKEIEKDLKNYFLKLELKPLFTASGFAFIENFFKLKYAANQFKIGQLTEYFSFSKATLQLILKDLNLLPFRGMPAKDSPEWVDWLFFNFNGKIYGHQKKSVYIKNTKFTLNNRQEEQLRALIALKEKGNS